MQLQENTCTLFDLFQIFKANRACTNNLNNNHLSHFIKTKNAVQLKEFSNWRTYLKLLQCPIHVLNKKILF